MVASRTFVPTVVVALLSFAGLAAEDKTDARSADLIKAAKTFVELLDKGEFAKATDGFDETMRKVLPPDQLKKTWQKVLDEAGDFRKQVGSRLEKSGKYEIVYVTCEFARMKRDARVVFDKDRKITGLFFGPVRKPTPTGPEEIWEGTLKVG